MTQAREWLERDVPATLPVMPLKSLVVFPLQVASVQVSRRQELELLEGLRGGGDLVAAAPLVDPEGPYARRNVGEVAVACRVLSRLGMADGTVQVVLQGQRRVRVVKVMAARPFFTARVACIDDVQPDDERTKDRIVEVMALVEQLVRVDPRYTDELVRTLKRNRDSGARLADVVADTFEFGYAAKRQVLEAGDAGRRLVLVGTLLKREIARSRVSQEVQAKTQVTIERAQREAYLRQELEVIRQELGELDPMETQISELEQRVHEASLPQPVAEEALREIQRLRMVGVRALEASTIRSYLDFVLALPFETLDEERWDLRRARAVLDKEHTALETAKERILEFLAVRKLGGTARAHVLGIVGPPGTGKSRLARTIARAIGRRFVRVPLVGLRDEAEVRGYRRTDVGALPGLVLEGVRRAGVRNPVILFDDVDELDDEEDDAVVAALVEAMDPERNARFRDHYLGVPFDLSRALFVVTANLHDDLPEALDDHMEVVELSGYTETEKVSIASRHVWPRVLAEQGLRERGVKLTRAALLRIIREYTREAGVSDLQHQLEVAARRLAARVALGSRAKLSIDARGVEKVLGTPIHATSPVPSEPQLGVATGLAWTSAGGDLLPIEALGMPGEGRTTLTGLLGEVMQESVAAALSYVRSRAEELGIDPESFKTTDLHIHFPEGAIPKDGPSAGITVAVTIASLLSGRLVRPNVAMTGELSLRGNVLTVGGLKEKVLAAYRLGIRRVILPARNASDLGDVPRDVQGKMTFHMVTHVDEVFDHALLGPRRASRRRNGRTRAGTRRKVAKGRTR